MAAIRSLYGSWCCEVGCCMWLFIKYIYIVEVVCEYVGVRLGGLNVFYGDEYGVQLCP